MSKLKFYVLTTRRLDRLKRHLDPNISGIPKEDLVVVINSLNNSYVQRASDWCEEENIEYYITESNGTAGKGKNSVLNLFNGSDNDYMVLVDGDDYLTPHGVWLYKHIAEYETPPDCICLFNQVALVLDIKKQDIIRKKFEEGGADAVSGDDIMVKASFPFTIDWRTYDNFINENGRSIPPRDLIESKKYYNKMRLYAEKAEAHCRVTWYSKKASSIPFKEELKVGEDTQQYLMLKNEAYHGRINILCTDELTPTYIYDNSIPGVVCEVGEFGTNTFNWMYHYNIEISSMERKGLLHNDFHLPEMKVDYEVDYVADAGDILNSHVWHGVAKGGERIEISHPANAIEECVLRKYNDEIESHTKIYKKRI